MNRKHLIRKLAEGIYSRTSSHPLRVAIDGVDAAGKTILANELAQYLEQKQRQVIRASLDDFHQPDHLRKAKGDLSPDGFYYDSFNYPDLIQWLLEPLGQDGNRLYKTAIFDLEHDQPVSSPVKKASRDAILLIDGIFLLRPGLASYWDLSIYLAISPQKSFERGTERDTKVIGSFEKAKERYNLRYLPGQAIYHTESHPLDKADIVIDNNDIENPKIIKIPLDF